MAFSSFEHTMNKRNVLHSICVIDTFLGLDLVNNNNDNLLEVRSLPKVHKVHKQQDGRQKKKEKY